MSRIGVHRLWNERVRLTFQEKLAEKQRGSKTVQKAVKAMWKHFKTALLEGAMEVCGTACIGYGNRGSAWWNENLRKLVEKRV